jgi:16S rRNA (adenine1518-N6/adenine1519-N6)-dimethyltransferase
VIAIEYDPRFIAIMEETLRGKHPARIVHGDVLKVNLREILLSMGQRRRKVAANLPYYITTPALARLLEQHDLLERIVVLVQKEVADRLSAKPGTPDYGSLSVFTQYYAEVERLFLVPGSAFLPPPKVSSAIVRLMIRSHPPVNVTDEALFFQLVRASFGQRRKTLLNALAGGTGKDRETVLSALQRAGLDPQRRGETLGLEDFALLANAWADEEPNPQTGTTLPTTMP